MKRKTIAGTENYVWIVEMWDGRRWAPTSVASLSRDQARYHMREDWQYNCPNDKFRVRRYASA